jgi:presenilin-like A22 family membrane protease
MLIVTFGGWSKLEGAKPLLIAYMIVYGLLAFFAARWNRGVLPLAAALGIILLIFAAISAPEWLARDKSGFTSPALGSSVVGLFTFLIIPVQVLLIAFAMRGFSQDWHVEVEKGGDEDTTIPESQRGRGGDAAAYA